MNKMPKISETSKKGTIAEWLVKKVEKIEKGDAFVELETDKVNVEGNSDYAGVLTEIISEEGDDVEVGDVIAKIDENAEAGDVSSESETEAPQQKEEAPKEEPKQEEKKEEQEAPKEDSDSKQDIIASPAARKRARELNVDLGTISANDPFGRIRPEDVDAAAKGGTEKKAEKPAKKEATKAPEKTEFDKPVERVKMSRRRQTIANRLVEVQQIGRAHV